MDFAIPVRELDIIVSQKIYSSSHFFLEKLTLSFLLVSHEFLAHLGVHHFEWVPFLAGISIKYF